MFTFPYDPGIALDKIKREVLSEQEKSGTNPEFTVEQENELYERAE